ncbi:MAG: hypothetical protein ONB54_00240 [candidate division KSB1 bacterium]|nr:hypothetical protein [candidate division KSB1 bacterium]MDZ7272897.1 hypothetical protein [candidate division KSB1 bacterium]MDZ7297522.1 hypothetical protein [candidate division KSB1 bacterium]MDZ7308258.1 hypothetical protein [candidate division KSB1 bacterium]MDZ7348389.1 hypothetical protein [candidate division KSB1 bacterium]
MALFCDPADALCRDATTKPWQIKKRTELSPRRLSNHATRQEHEGKFYGHDELCGDEARVWQFLQKNSLPRGDFVFVFVHAFYRFKNAGNIGLPACRQTTFFRCVSSENNFCA